MNTIPENLHFPLDNVNIRRTDTPKEIGTPLFTNSWMSISEDEFRMTVNHVGTFYAGFGSEVEYSSVTGASPSSLELYLNGSVYGAILHQRRILPIHGSSFIFDGKGVMICGESGAGKSSITAAFCLNGAEFLTDDVTPFQFENNRPLIIPRSDRIKLWENSLNQLSRNKQELTKIRPEDEKYYMPLEQSERDTHPLHTVLLIKVKESGEPEFEPVHKVSAFSALHDEIYRLEYLNYMQEAKNSYLKKIVDICNHCNIITVHRPSDISIIEMHTILAEYLPGISHRY